MTLKLPKAELHCHIEGAASVNLAQQQAVKYGLDISDVLNGQHYKWHDFSSFITAYDTVANLFKSEGDYALLAEDYLTSIAQDGAIYSEIFVSPDHAKSAGLSPDAYFNGLAAGMELAKAKTGIISRMIIVGVRHLGADNVKKAAQLAAKRPHPLITGFGMVGDERFGAVSDFSEAFDITRDADLGLTIHAGELSGPQSVRDALDYIKPSRIGHGVRAIEDPELVQRLADENIVLEVCPGSNISLNVFDDLQSHPLKQLKDAGVILTLSSDDPPFFATDLADEYRQVSKTFDFSQNEMLEFTKNALKAAFVDNSTKDKLLAQL
jgi:adenosine deaminase